ncbi:MAG: hypothetical protein JWM80_323 [Cyanobacteria bacterium RYN_339]|nr:hypothetical protein [Cyanobacteria bacterium RYN_339]
MAGASPDFRGAPAILASRRERVNWKAARLFLPNLELAFPLGGGELTLLGNALVGYRLAF